MLAGVRSLCCFGETWSPPQGREYHVCALRWMRRNDDRTGAFGRSRLRKLDAYLARTKINARRLAERLAEAPNLIPPVETDGTQHNWYRWRPS